MSKKEVRKLLGEFLNCAGDIERWKWVKENQDKNITVFCDNDLTYISIESDNEEDSGDFDECIGWNDGVFSLLEACGIKAESV